MKVQIVFLAIVGASLAVPVEEAFVNLSEDTTGNYKLNFVSKDASRTEERIHTGKVIGSYSYYDDLGVKHTINYVAGENEGFHAQGADILPPVAEPVDIIHARNAHLETLAKERATNPHAALEEKPVDVHQVLTQLTIPKIAGLPASAVPVDDAEISAAKAQLLSAYAKALERLAEEYKRH